MNVFLIRWNQLLKMEAESVFGCRNANETALDVLEASGTCITRAGLAAGRVTSEKNIQELPGADRRTTKSAK